MGGIDLPGKGSRINFASRLVLSDGNGDDKVEGCDGLEGECFYTDSWNSETFMGLGVNLVQENLSGIYEGDPSEEA